MTNLGPLPQRHLLQNISDTGVFPALKIMNRDQYGQPPCQTERGGDQCSEEWIPGEEGSDRYRDKRAEREKRDEPHTEAEAVQESGDAGGVERPPPGRDLTVEVG